MDAVAALQPGIAGDGTALGDALASALKRLKNLPDGTRAIVTVTDGASNAGRVEPMTAAQVAQEMGVTIHTIGVGGEEPNSDQSAPYDEKTLGDIAALTHGIYRNASDVQALRTITAEIKKLLETNADTDNHITIVEYSYIFAVISGISFLLLLLIEYALFPVTRVRGLHG